MWPRSYTNASSMTMPLFKGKNLGGRISQTFFYVLSAGICIVVSTLSMCSPSAWVAWMPPLLFSLWSTTRVIIVPGLHITPVWLLPPWLLQFWVIWPCFGGVTWRSLLEVYLPFSPYGRQIIKSTVGSPFPIMWCAREQFVCIQSADFSWWMFFLPSHDTMTLL